jgi:hypothetical protein
VGHALSDHGAESRIVEPSFWIIMGLCGIGLLRCLGAWRCPQLLFLVVCGCLIIAVGSVSICGGSLVVRCACQDGKGPQSAGRSVTGVVGCNSWSSISHLMLHESSYVGSHVGRSGRLRCLEKSVIDFLP